MKKITKWIFLLMILLFWLLFFAKTSAQSNAFGMITINFCNDNQTNKEVDMVSKAGNTVPICVAFTNQASTPITINVEFLDSIITADALKDRACNAPDRPKTQFWNFLLPYVWETILPPQTTIKKEYKIKYPLGFSWVSHGCLAYNIVWGDISNSGMFTVRVRAVKYLDILVSDGKISQVVTMSQKPTIKKVGDEYVITMWVKNKGNVDEKIHITSTLFNILGFKKDFIFDVIIPADTGILLTTPSFILPGYWGLFLLNGSISYEPQFNFNITNGKQPSQLYTWWTKNIQNLFFIWTRISWVVLLVVLLLILSWIWKKQGKKIIS